MNVKLTIGPVVVPNGVRIESTVVESTISFPRDVNNVLSLHEGILENLEDYDCVEEIKQTDVLDGQIEIPIYKKHILREEFDGLPTGFVLPETVPGKAVEVAKGIKLVKAY